MKKILPIFCLSLTVFIPSFSFADSITVSFREEIPQVEFALSRLELAVAQHEDTLLFGSLEKADDANITVVIGAVDQSQAKLDLPVQTDLGDEDYQILTPAPHQLVVYAIHPDGAMYGLLDLAEQYRFHGSLNTITSKTTYARFPFRTIKYNLPWMSYRKGKSLQLHMETCRDLAYWEQFLTMMAENRFNTLSLWNLHPFTYMIRPANFPKACPFTDEELQEWQAFWKSLFQMAAERGIETYIVNWNIFVSPQFAEHYGAAEYNKEWSFFGDADRSKDVEKYTRECVTQVLNEYENLTGIGITLGERMGGMTARERRDWIDRTVIAGMENAGREAKLLYRAPLSAGKGSGGSTSKSTEQLTREALESMIDVDEPIWVSFKYNWSHGHSSPHLHIVHGGELTDTYWNPQPDNYKIIWTVRNEDFFVLRWGQPDFIRDFITNNGQDYVGGCIIGSECYIPAKDYIHQENAHKTWDYAFERQWLFYSLWGHLLYDPSTPDAFFANQLRTKFKTPWASELLSAWSLASRTPLRLASFYRGTWDATLYSEGHLRNAQGDNSGFINIDRLINHPVLDPQFISIKDFVKSGGYVDRGKISPLHLADMLERDCKKAQHITAKIRAAQKGKPELECELLDIDTWSWMGRYLAQKLRGGVALETFRQTGKEAENENAIHHLEQAAACWEHIVELTESHQNHVIPYVFDETFSWRKYYEDVKKDIQTAREAKAKQEQ